ncbi:MAG TPA: FkbM family methyltransferase [Candidatus Kryptobacter bacterium]|nr:FkbM family methyltransferase [Candidatus Kryptobacter bacterium]
MLSFRKMHRDARSIYSQTGEDHLIHIALRSLKIDKPTYIDIGAHHPTYTSNTYGFYQGGAHGVCVEPNPKLARLFRKKRPHDTVLETAVGPTSGITTLHIASHTGLSTISPAQVEFINEASKFSITKEIQVPVKTVMDILKEHFPVTPPDFISMDIEGMDLAVLETFDFSICKPPVFCIETLAHDKDGRDWKVKEIEALMVSNGYFVFADTYLSTIFVNKELWDACKQSKR